MTNDPVIVGATLWEMSVALFVSLAGIILYDRWRYGSSGRIPKSPPCGRCPELERQRDELIALANRQQESFDQLNAAFDSMSNSFDRAMKIAKHGEGTSKVKETIL